MRAIFSGHRNCNTLKQKRGYLGRMRTRRVLYWGTSRGSYQLVEGVLPPPPETTRKKSVLNDNDPCARAPVHIFYLFNGHWKVYFPSLVQLKRIFILLPSPPEKKHPFWTTRKFAKPFSPLPLQTSGFFSGGCWKALCDLLAHLNRIQWFVRIWEKNASRIRTGR